MFPTIICRQYIHKKNRVTWVTEWFWISTKTSLKISKCVYMSTTTQSRTQEQAHNYMKWWQSRECKWTMCTQTLNIKVVRNCLRNSFRWSIAMLLLYQTEKKIIFNYLSSLLIEYIMIFDRSFHLCIVVTPALTD